MNKKILISIFLVMAVCLAGCSFNANKTGKSKVRAGKTVASKNSVPQTYEEWVAKNGVPQKTSGVAANRTPAASSVPVQTNSNAKVVKGVSNVKGEDIPAWVFENTLSSDDYYDVISSYNNVVFFSYADCPIGQGRRDMVSRAINRAGAASKFIMNADLHPEGSSTMAICKKEGAGADCAINYLFENCTGEICIINPRARKIVKVSPDEEQLVAKLNELKTNW